jgi:hypothetical protein
MEGELSPTRCKLGMNCEHGMDPIGWLHKHTATLHYHKIGLICTKDVLEQGI